MAFIDISRQEQADINKRERALQSGIEKSFLGGLDIGRQEKQKRVAQENLQRNTLRKEKNARAQQIVNLQNSLTKLGASLPEGSEDLFSQYIKTGDSTVIKPIFDKQAEFIREQKDRELKIKESKAKKETSEGSGVFSKEFLKQSAREYQKEITNLPKVTKQIEGVNKTINDLIAFERSSFAGTGPIAQFTTANPIVSKNAENLDRQFKRLQLDEMKRQFSGMSKAIDSDAERRFFEQSQPSLGNRPETNIQMLLGLQSLALKQKAETEAKRNHLKRNKNLLNYESPIINRALSMVDKNGKMVLIAKENLEEAKNQGYLELDDYVNKLFPNSKSFGQGLLSPRDAVANDELEKVKRMSREEKLRLLRGQ